MNTNGLERQEMEAFGNEEWGIEEWEIEDWEADGQELEQWKINQLKLRRLKEEQLEEERRKRRRQRIEEMKREKHKREMMFRYVVPAVTVAFGLFIGLGISVAIHLGMDRENGEQENFAAITAQNSDSAEVSVAQRLAANVVSPIEPVGEEQIPTALENFTDSIPQEQLLNDVQNTMQTGTVTYIGTMLPNMSKPVFEAHATENTNGFSDAIVSDYGIMIDVENGEVLAQKDGWSRISPASMTKILTLLVAAEHVKDLDDTFVMTIDITDYSFQHGCSNTGFEVGEEIPIKDLFYGTALPSGADAALGLAHYVAGSQEAFVDMMNEKLDVLGLSETSHFTNCIGLYDENHYSTPYDMAVILKEAADNELCRQVLSQHHYVTTPTANHPDGIDISNWFLRRIEDRDTHGEVLCAKTGYVVQSRNCAASLGVDHEGREYICVTAGSSSVWTCIKDQVELYQRYLPE